MSEPVETVKELTVRHATTADYESQYPGDVDRQVQAAHDQEPIQDPAQVTAGVSVPTAEQAAKPGQPVEVPDDRGAVAPAQPKSDEEVQSGTPGIPAPDASAAQNAEVDADPGDHASRE